MPFRLLAGRSKRSAKMVKRVPLQVKVATRCIAITDEPHAHRVHNDYCFYDLRLLLLRLRLLLRRLLLLHCSSGSMSGNGSSRSRSSNSSNSSSNSSSSSSSSSSSRSREVATIIISSRCRSSEGVFV